MGYRSLRLPFGIKCAPTLLLVSMFKILIVDAEYDGIEMQNLKRVMYALLYMDNGGNCGDSSDDLEKYY